MGNGMCDASLWTKHCDDYTTNADTDAVWKWTVIFELLRISRFIPLVPPNLHMPCFKIQFGLLCKYVIDDSPDCTCCCSTSKPWARIEIAWQHCTPDHGVYLSNFAKSYHPHIAKLVSIVDNGLHDSTISDCMSPQSLSLHQMSAAAQQDSHWYTSITERRNFDATSLRTKPSVIRV